MRAAMSSMLGLTQLLSCASFLTSLSLPYHVPQALRPLLTMSLGNTNTNTNSNRGSRSLIRVADEREFPIMAQFFVSNWWATDMMAGQRKQLEKEELDDFRRRYGELVGKRKYPSSLLVAEENGVYVGCIGVDCKVVDEETGEVESPTFGTPLSACIPVIANLVVSREMRGRGLGKRLIAAAEERVKNWDFNKIALLVDEENYAARKLYTKLGFKEIFVTDDASRIVPSKWSLKEERCTNIYMKKSIGLASSPLATIPGFAEVMTLFR